MANQMGYPPGDISKPALEIVVSMNLPPRNLQAFVNDAGLVFEKYRIWARTYFCLGAVDP